ncbi:LPXTG cell wall anchor domain-containing protein [uncultured Ruminococcus sp.]
MTNGDNNITTLPQTGYSDIYLKIVVVAVLMTICGTMLIVKSRKETE